MSTIDVPVPDAPPVRVHRVPAPKPRGSTVVLLHELFGVDAELLGLAEQLAGLGHDVLAPELYHRTAEPGTVLARDDAGRAAGFDHLGQLTREQVLATVTATVGAAADQERVGLLGFSVGGHVAYLTAAELPVATSVCVYPGWLAGGQLLFTGPTPTVELTPGITGTLTVVVGDHDHLIDAEEVEVVRRALDQAGIDHRIVVIAGAGHAFFWPGTASYDESAHGQTLDVLKSALDGL